MSENFPGIRFFNQYVLINNASEKTIEELRKLWTDEDLCPSQWATDTGQVWCRGRFGHQGQCGTEIFFGAKATGSALGITLTPPSV